jgi:hypothetical protein
MTKSEKLSQSWLKRKDFVGGDIKSSIYTTHRAICYTSKGKKIGYPEEWQRFKDFKDIMSSGFVEGYHLIRTDKTLPYSKENCQWLPKHCDNLHTLITLEFNGETKTLLEWCEIYDLNYTRTRRRYFLKNRTSEEVLFGKIYSRKLKVIQDKRLLCTQELRNKISKMLSSYKCRDKRKGYEFKMSFDDLYDIVHKPCVYCGDNRNIGCDRLDNNRGHSLDNVVPCCYTCNVMKSDIWSYEEMREIGKVVNLIKMKKQINDEQYNTNRIAI